MATKEWSNHYLFDEHIEVFWDLGSEAWEEEISLSVRLDQTKQRLCRERRIKELA